MAIDMTGVNYLAVFVAGVVCFVLGWLWYGPLFGKQWLNLMKISKKDVDNAKQKGMAGFLLINFISTLITTYVLAVLMNTISIVAFSEAMILSFWLWLGFLLATTLIGGVLWEGKPTGLLVLNGAYWLVNLEVMATVLTLF